MKKFITAVFVIMIVPALILTYFWLKGSGSREKSSTPDTVQPVKTEEVSYRMDPILSSPLQKLSIRIEQDESGGVVYSVADAGGLVLLGKSAVGINTDLCDFSQGLSFVSQIPAKIVDEKYANISGKRSVSRNYYRETVLTFEKNEFLMDVYFRAYEDGFAYRFAIRSKDGGQTGMQVIAETGSFAVPAGSRITAELTDSVSAKFCYENLYSTHSVEWLSEKRPGYVCFPALIAVADESGSQSGKYLLLSEADMISSSYRGSVLGIGEDNTFVTQAAPAAGETPTVITTDFLSPWRFGVYGEAGDIALSDMAENLSPSSVGDFSWVEPGVTAWTWLSEKKAGQNSKKIITRYIDLASEMHWKYLILDEGWQPASKKKGRVYEGYYKWFDEVVSYADSKGVGLIVWLKYADLDTPEEREVLREYAAKGVKGIKADFFDSEDQVTMADLNEIYRICAECHLIVNCHGAGKPTGERRTYPNVINREAARGEEYGGNFVNQAVIWAYTRSVVGPVDLTPRVYPKSKTSTLGLQLASCVILESGMPCMAGSASDYRKFNGASFYKDLPASWDETVFLGGEVGEYVAMARRSGDVWYAAVITKNARKGMSIPLKFLGKGEFQAVLYSDSTKNKLSIITRDVNQYDILSFDLLPESGYAVKIAKKES